MVDDTLPHESHPAVTPPELQNAEQHADEVPQSSVIRTRVIPAIAGLMLAAIIGLILWSMFAPESARPQSNRQIGGAIVLNNPEPVEDFSLEPLGGGDVVSLSAYRGKTVLINFWASWCQPCVREIPILMQAAREFDANTVLIGIDTLDEVDDALAMQNEFGINYLTLDDNGSSGGSVAVDFGLVGVPETYLINPNGELVAFRRGEFESVQDVHDMIALAQ